MTDVAHQDMTTMTNKMQDHSSAIQGLQVDMRHVVKVIDKLAIVADNQVELTHELKRQNDCIERNYSHMGEVESKLATAIGELTTVIRADRVNADDVAKTVTGYKGGLKTLMIVGGTVVSLLSIIGWMFSQSVNREQARTTLDFTKLEQTFESRKLAVDLKMDSLMQQVQEVRINRGWDREGKGQPGEQ